MSKKINRLPATAILFISALLLFVPTLLLTTYFGLNDLIIAKMTKVLEVLASNTAEYFFFIGSTFISLLLLKSRRWIIATIVFLIGTVWVVFHLPLVYFVNGLGTDSFSEARNLDIDEAIFWITTLSEVIRPNFNINYLTLYITLALMCFLSLKWISARRKLTAQHYPFIMFAIAVILIGTAIYQTASNVIALFLQHSESFSATKQNFDIAPPPIRLDESKINLVVYIGESTSIMNMGVYGYPRNTTPKLSELEMSDTNLLVFDNVFSTHTHTTYSLLEALSFAVDENENYLPINHRKRVSIVDILNSGGIVPTLYSNQGMTGTWNQAASIIFRNAEGSFSIESKHLGNNDLRFEKPWDNDFLVGSLRNRLANRVEGKRIIFLHSEAGHGPYLDSIPEAFRDPVDNLFKERNAKSIMGNEVGSLDDVEAYDSTIRYIDFSISESIQAVRNSQEPTIFLYFPDHGDAVFAGRGHDSSRFIHEMARVPLVLYFNDAARRANESLYEKYKTLAGRKEVSTLAQIPSTLLDLMGAEIEDKRSAAVVQTPVIGESTSHPPIMVRETTEGITYVNINKLALTPPVDFDNTFLDKSDDATRIFSTTVNNDNKSTIVCYHRSDTLGKALRGSLVSDCLEIDLVVEANGELAVYHPPEKNVGFGLDELLDLASTNTIALWIDSKNLQTRLACSTLSNFLKSSKPVGKPILIEFPPGSYKNKTELDSCAKDLRDGGFFTSYYVPTDIASSCSRLLINGESFDSEPICRALKQDLKLALDSGLYSDFSFDYSGIKAIENIESAKKLRWNTWHVTPQTFDQIMPERFRMIILSNSDPNNL